MRHGEKQHTVCKRPVREIALRTVKKNPVVTAGLAAVIAAAVVVSVLPPLVLAKAVDLLTGEAGVPGGMTPSGAVLRYALLYFGLTALSGGSDALREVLITVFGQKITHETRSAMNRKLTRLPAAYFAAQESGVTTSRFVDDVNAVESLFSSGIISMIADACQIVSILIVIFHISRGLFLMLAAALPLLFFLTRVIQKQMLAAQWDNRVAVGRTNQQIPETVRNQRTIRTLRIFAWREKKYHRCVRDGFDAMERSNFCDAIYSPIIMTVKALLVALMMILAVTVTGVQSLFGMNAGTVVALIAYIGKVFSPLESIGMEIQNIQEAMAGIGRIREFLGEKERVIPEGDALPEESDPVIEFKHVTFGYEPETTVLHDFSMTVCRGETVTLEGRTGAGKSTCFKLILGLYRPQSGSVTVMGIPAEKYTGTMLSRTFGYVEQSFAMIRGSVRDQITLHDPSVTEEMVRDALKETGMLEVCENLPRGLDTPCRDSLFSEGQKQLLSIARAIVRDPEILLLDEITANLDSITEAQIMRTLREASANRTVLSISHRLYQEQGGRRVTPV